MDELGECDLGRQDFWDDRYKEDISHFHTHGDVGEIWFGEDIVDRIVGWINKHYSADKSKSILDVGCGNGMLLIELSREGYTKLKGVDYSKEAIVLAKQIADKHNSTIEFDEMDVLAENSALENIDIILDKGTYDAISLSEDAKNNRLKYIENMCKFLHADGVLVITSCNWTKEELIEQFVEKFIYHDYIPTPQFKFAGKVGSVVSSVVFKKRKSD